MTASRNFDLAELQARAVERGCTKEAVARFAERYPEHCRFRDNGNPISVVPRLRLALCLARESRAKILLAHADRWIFDVELPADAWNPEPYTIRILTSPAVDCVLTVLPREFHSEHARNVMADRQTKARRSKKFHRRIVDEEIIELEESAEPVTLPPPVKLGAGLGDKLRQALGQ